MDDFVQFNVPFTTYLFKPAFTQGFTGSLLVPFQSWLAWSDLLRATLDLEMSEDHNILLVWEAVVNPSKSKRTTIAGFASIWHVSSSKTKIAKDVLEDHFHHTYLDYSARQKEPCNGEISTDSRSWSSVPSLRSGFCKFIQVCLRLVPLGCMIAGPPCGSWVWVNRATSRRSKKFPLGDSKKNISMKTTRASSANGWICPTPTGAAKSNYKRCCSLLYLYSHWSI